MYLDDKLHQSRLSNFYLSATCNTQSQISKVRKVDIFENVNAGKRSFYKFNMRSIKFFDGLRNLSPAPFLKLILF